MKNTYIKEMWPQSSYCVLGDIGGELLASATEEEHADYLVGLPDPGRYLPTKYHAGAPADVVAKSYPFREAHLEKIK